MALLADQTATPRASHFLPLLLIQHNMLASGVRLYYTCASSCEHTLSVPPGRPTACRRVIVSSGGPSARYAHTLALVGNRYLVAMGGNDGR